MTLQSRPACSSRDVGVPVASGCGRRSAFWDYDLEVVGDRARLVARPAVSQGLAGALPYAPFPRCAVIYTGDPAFPGASLYETPEVALDVSRLLRRRSGEVRLRCHRVIASVQRPSGYSPPPSASISVDWTVTLRRVG